MFQNLLTIVTLALSVSAAPTISAAGAAYFITNGNDANHVVTSAIATDGTLTFGRVVATGGKGSHANATGFDALFSQGPVRVSGSSLFTVNAGSNDVSSFAIKATDPTQLTQIGQPVSSQGDFPISLAVNSQSNDVYVLNGGANNGISGFKFDQSSGLSPISDSARTIGVKQTTPPAGPPTTLTQVFFTLDNKFLLASVKGSPPPGEPGFIAAWEHDAATGSISNDFTAITPPKGGALPFGFSFLPHNPSVVLLTDPALGYDVLDLKASLATSNGNASSILASSAARTVPAAGASKSIPIAGQGAVCWSAFSSVTGNFYLMDPNANMVNEITVNSATLESSLVMQYPLGAGHTPLDGTIANIGGKDFLYIIAPESSTIEVFALPAIGKAKKIQSFSYAAGLSAAGLDLKSVQENIVGMAAFSTK
ncbi:hypothetical protein BKA62DRAFT_348307 [Auriculariales sp. MPI-PUGE-AT-0066]|nr:hypothetical protein BKA62DRAFT_348307 [Auriculariales sp. MPI-PUGE-AT-0066]